MPLFDPSVLSLSPLSCISWHFSSSFSFHPLSLTLPFFLCIFFIFVYNSRMGFCFFAPAHSFVPRPTTPIVFAFVFYVCRVYILFRLYTFDASPKRWPMRLALITFEATNVKRLKSKCLERLWLLALDWRRNDSNDHSFFCLSILLLFLVSLSGIVFLLVCVFLSSVACFVPVFIYFIICSVLKHNTCNRNALRYTLHVHI